VGENNLGRRVLKEVWGINWGREVIIKIVRGSLRLRYVCERWRRGVRIIMRKPNKLDYGLLSSYRVINSVRYGAGRGGFSLCDPAVTPARGQLFAVPPRPV